MISANLNNQTRKEVYKRDDYMCALCGGTRGLQVHHVTARSQGGSNSLHNLITLCHICHANAHNNMMSVCPHSFADIQQHIVEYLADFYLEDYSPDWLP